MEVEARNTTHIASDPSPVKEVGKRTSWVSYATILMSDMVDEDGEAKRVDY